MEAQLAWGQWCGPVRGGGWLLGLVEQVYWVLATQYTCSTMSATMSPIMSATSGS